MSDEHSTQDKDRSKLTITLGDRDVKLLVHVLVVVVLGFASTLLQQGIDPTKFLP